MKLNLPKDLTPLRDQARQYVLGQFARTTRSPLAEIHAQKLADAQAFKAGQPASTLLTDEAAIRGITVDELATLVIARAVEAQQTMVTAELYRQEQLQLIDSANSEQELYQIMGLPPAPSNLGALNDRQQ